MTEPLEDIVAAIRKRPGMYVGDVHDGSGLLHLLWEVVGNAIDEHLAGFCRRIAVTLHDDGRVTVVDDGRGIPVDPLSDGVSLLETVLTRMHDSATFDRHEKHVHLDSHGVGLVAVNAVCRETVVESVRGGRLYRQEFRAGFAVGPLLDLGVTGRTGTRFSFVPDPAIFPWVDLDATQIRERLHYLAGLCPGLVVHFADERRSVFSCPNGIVDLLARQHPGGAPMPTPALHATGSEGRVRVEVALQWSGHRWDGAVRSFVNLYETLDGGSHVAGLKKGLSELLHGIPRQERSPLTTALQERVVGVVSVFHHAPSFDAPTRSKLTSPEVRPVVEAVVRRCLRDFAATRPEELRRLLAVMRPAVPPSLH